MKDEPFNENLKKVSGKLAEDLFNQLKKNKALKEKERKEWVSSKAEKFLLFLTREYSDFYKELDHAIQTLFNEISKQPIEESKEIFAELSKLGSRVQELDAVTVFQKTKEGETPQNVFGLSSKTMQTFLEIGAKQLEDEKFEDAVAIFRFLSLLNPNLLEYWVSYGYALKSLGQVEEALLAYTIAELIDPDHPLPRIYAIEIHLLLNNPEEATRELKNLEKIVKKEGFVQFKEVVEDFQHYLSSPS